MAISVLYNKTGNVVIGALHQELYNASVPIEGVSWLSEQEKVRIDYQDIATPSDISSGQAIVIAHDGVDYDFLVSDQADEDAQNIPNFADWSKDTFLAWYATNVEDEIAAIGNLAEARVVLATMATVMKKIALMEIALRNKQWPGLQEKP